MKSRAGLHAVVRTADGTEFRWDRFTREPGNRLASAKKGSRMMDGFGAGTIVLPRKANVSAADLEQYAQLGLYDDDGYPVYEGRLAYADGDRATDRISVQVQSNMAHARDRALDPLLIVDRDLRQWQGYTSDRKAALTGFGYVGGDGTIEDARALLSLGGLPFDSGYLPARAIMYKAPPGADIGHLKATRALGSGWTPADSNYNLYQVLTDSADLSGGDASADLASGNGTTTVSATAMGRQWAAIECSYGAAVAGSDNIPRTAQLTDIIVVGTHGIEQIDYYYRVSDLIRYTAGLAAPLLDTSGIGDTDFVVGQLRTDDEVFAYDLWLMLNKTEMRNLAVWENRRMEYEPIGRDGTPDWQVRSDDPRVRVKFDQPTPQSQANGVTVRFQNVLTGFADIVTPESDPDELAITDPNLPANKWGIQAWEPLVMSEPDTPANALRYGQHVRDMLRAQRRPGRITIRGHVRDMSEAERGVARIRSNDSIVVDDDDVARVIYDEDYDFLTDLSTLTVDSQPKDADAILDELLTQQALNRRGRSRWR